MSKFKFNPLNYGYEPAKNFPELDYVIPTRSSGWYVKAISYMQRSDGKLVYWYSAIKINMLSVADDDRVCIYAGVHDFAKPNAYNIQGRLRQEYLGLISSDQFAKDLLSHILAATSNESVLECGIQRLNQNIGEKMRKEFPSHYPVLVSPNAE